MNKELLTEQLTEDERSFLALVHDPVSRPALLDRLAQLGLLVAFREIENGTI